MALPVARSRADGRFGVLAICALVVGGIVIAGGLAAAASYYVPIATADRTPWRRHRDRIAALDWFAAGLFPIALSVVLEIIGHVALQHRALELAVALISFLSGGLAGIVLSGVVDWYVILPRLAGMLGEPPCRSSRDPRWKWVTIGWFLHRALAAIATIVGATGALIVIAFYVFGHIDEFIAGEIVTVMGLLAASYKFRLPTAAMLILNPRVHVDSVLYRSLFDDGPITSYVVDVSLEGVKVKDVASAPGRPVFQSKDGAAVGLNKLDDYLRRESFPYLGCRLAPGGCAGINWYCKNNPTRS